MRELKGVSGAWNYTIGQALRYRGVSSLDAINLAPMPVVVVAEYVPLSELGRIDLHHVLGFVLERGGMGDPARVFYSNQYRATVMQCEGILDAARDGTTLVVDGVDGKVFVDPDAATIEKYEALRKQGPPPEPPGFTDQLIKDAMEMATLDPKALKEGFFDFDELTAAFGSFMQMHRFEVLGDKDVKQLEKMVKGTKHEASVTANLAKYQTAVKDMSEEERQERQARVGASQ